jgi:rhodanese-related sulfurtransferase
MVEEKSVQELHDDIASGAVILIDVREADEFATSHIPYALSIPMSVFDRVFPMMNFERNKPLVFHCKVGGRSQRVCDYVSSIPDHESRIIINMTGGILAWAEADYILIQ